MAAGRTKANMNNESFHQRYSELSDEVRFKNKREDRLLDVRLKYYEREKNIRMNLCRKEQYQLERTRSALLERWIKIQEEKQKRTIPSYVSERPDLPPALIQLSTPEIFLPDSQLSSDVKPSPLISSIPVTKPTKIVRPHSAG